jgi:hypothetical protein
MASPVDVIIDPWMGVKHGSVHSNPYYTYSQLYSPKFLKELFKWCEYLFYRSTHIFAALRKFGEYPITKITYETNNDSLRSKHQYLLEQVIRVRELLIKATLDKYIYGNTFISMYQPFVRYLKCGHCGVLTNIKNVNYTFSVKNLTFAYKCEACNKHTKITLRNVQDRKLMVGKLINFIRWDPKQIDIDHNPITGESIYYYKIPRDIIQQINNGHKTLIDTLPLGFLKAVSKEKAFKFATKAVFHMKIGGPAGINPQWGLPPLLSALESFHYTAILRKANEAIALDHLVPYRIIHPAQSSSVADPMQAISLQTWQWEMARNFKLYRRDPLHIMWSPIPVGMTQIGGQGRALLTLGEIQEAEKNIVSSLGIPIEFLRGGLTQSGMEATLRLIENQLATHIADIKDLLQWISDSCASFMGWDKLKTGLTPFKMVDDQAKQQLLFQLWQAGQQGGPQIISNTTIAEINEIDLKREEDRIKQETLDNVRRQQEIELEIKDLQNNMARNVQEQAQQGKPGGYDQQKIIADADAIVTQLSQVDQGTRRSMLHQLEVEDYVLYSVVIQRWQQEQTTTKQQATAEIKNG